MQVFLISPEKRFFEGISEHVYLPGAAGPFEVLPKHAPLISLLGKGELSILSGTTLKRYHIQGGFAEVVRDTITILADTVKES